MDFDPTLKKKKKKKVILEDADDEAVEAVTGEMDDLDVEGFGKKKKKKSKSKEAGEEGEDAGDDEGLRQEEEEEEEEEEGLGRRGRGGGGRGRGRGGEDRVRFALGRHDEDYHYDELLGRVFGILREKNPALSEKTKTIIKPPQVLREGTKKTVFANLMEICAAMHRPHEHVTQYIWRERERESTLDGTNRLIIKGGSSQGVRGRPAALLHRLRHLPDVQVLGHAAREGPQDEAQLVRLPGVRREQIRRRHPKGIPRRPARRPPEGEKRHLIIKTRRRRLFLSTTDYSYR